MLYSKTCLKRPLKRKTKIVFQDQLSINAGQKYCRMLQESILQYFWPPLSYHLSLRPLFCLFLSGCLRQVLLYFMTQQYDVHRTVFFFYLIKYIKLYFFTLQYQIHYNFFYIIKYIKLYFFTLQYQIHYNFFYIIKYIKLYFFTLQYQIHYNFFYIIKYIKLYFFTLQYQVHYSFILLHYNIKTIDLNFDTVQMWNRFVVVSIIFDHFM